MTREETKKATPEEINFMNSFIWFKPKYPNYEDVRLIMGRHISEVAGIPKNRRNPDFYERNLFLNSETMEWEDWNENAERLKRRTLMTRDKLWEIITTKLVWVDYWSGQEEPSDEVKEILTNSLLIPQPKFQVGDKVQVVNRGELWQFLIYERYFNPDKGIWIYEDDHYSPFDEDELELVERKEK